MRIFVEFEHPSGVQEWKKLVLARIRDRGECHQSLTASNGDLPKIIDGFLKSYQGLTDNEKKDLVVKLNVVDPVTTWISRIQEVFDDNKINECKFAMTPTQVTTVVRSVLDEEKHVKKASTETKKTSTETKKTPVATKKVLYYGISFDECKELMAHSVVVSTLAKFPTVRPQTKFHVTLRFFGGKGTEADEKPYADLVGNKINVTVTGIVCDEKGIAVSVLLPDNIVCTNKQPHITIGNDNVTKPVYSNELFTKVSALSFEPLLTLKGTVIAV